MSGPRVTITLGRSGQVVRKAPSEADGSDYVSSPGRKRPMRERLGANFDNSKNKRLRVENNRWSRDGEDEMYIPAISRDDLRYKLMRKSLFGRKVGNMERGDPDLRKVLSRTVQPPIRYVSMQMQPSDSQPSSILRRIPPTRSAEDLLRLESMRKSYSSRRADDLRHRSPDRFLSSSRGGISSARSIDDLRTVSSLRHIHAARPSNPYLTRGTVDASRPTTFMTKTPVPVESVKPVTRLPPTTGAVHKSSYMEQAEEPLSVAALLHSLALGKYAINFQAEEVDMAALKQMGDSDLKDLGIPMGPRKKILLAVMPRSRQRPI